MIIGQDLQRDAIAKDLDACCMTDEEWALRHEIEDELFADTRDILAATAGTGELDDDDDDDGEVDEEE